jgi:hypothetical protein
VGGVVVRIKKVLAMATTVAFLSLSGLALGAAPRFSQQSVRGRYTGSFAVSENVAAGGGLNAEIQATEIVIENFDGSGGLSGSAIVVARVPSSSNPQTVCNFDQSGTYTVGGDGTVTMTFTLTDASASGCGSAIGTMNGVISNSGRRMDSVITNVQNTSTNFINAIIGSGAIFRQ